MATLAVLKATFAGAAFGGALTASGMTAPAIVVNQMKGEDWYMVATFLSATGATAIISYAASTLNIANLKPRSYNTLGWFAPFDGNLIGGALFGAGMTLSGSCPSMLFAQVALGLRSAVHAVQGGVLGGIIFTSLVRPYVNPPRPAPAPAAGSTAVASKPAAKPAELQVSVGGALGVSRLTALVLAEALIAVGLAVIIMTLPLSTSDAKLAPLYGGALIALSQLTSVLVRGTLVGVSTVYEELGDWLWWVARDKAKQADAKRPSLTSVGLAAGVFGGATLVARLAPGLVNVKTVAVAPAAAVAGGFLMAVGSRIAGGCTAGHGISGMSLLSISSIITTVAALAGGAVAAKLIS